MKKIKAVVFGVGTMNSIITRMLLEKGVEIIGAISRSPAKVGKDLGELTGDRKSTRLNSSHSQQARMPSSA